MLSGSTGILTGSFMAVGIGDDCPILRRRDVELEPCFQIRLIETRKRHVRVHGNEKCVDVFAAVVLVLKARDGLSRRRNGCLEVDYDYVLVQLEQSGRKL